MVENKERDIYHSLRKYQTSRESINTDVRILESNKKIILAWLERKEEDLKTRKGQDFTASIRWAKTMNKYVVLLKNFGHWIQKPFQEITQEDLQQLYKDLETGKIKSKKGVPFSKSTRQDYYNKLFKGDFFDFINKIEIAKKVFRMEKDPDEHVKFFLKSDLDKMLKFTTKTRNKFFLTLLFDTGVRVGTALNLRKKDIEKRFNQETKEYFYLIHIRKEYTKSRREENIGTWLPETTELLDQYLEEVAKDDDLLFNFSYQNARKLVTRVSIKGGIITKPDNESITLHDFRRSSATYWLTKKVSIDSIKKRLGHRPSSTVIDKYVSYLGINEEQIVTELQEKNYGELLQRYNELTEQFKVSVRNNQELNDRMQVIEETVIPKIAQSLPQPVQVPYTEGEVATISRSGLSINDHFRSFTEEKKNKYER